MSLEANSVNTMNPIVWYTHKYVKVCDVKNLSILSINIIIMDMKFSETEN